MGTLYTCTQTVKVFDVQRSSNVRIQRPSNYLAHSSPATTATDMVLLYRVRSFCTGHTMRVLYWPVCRADTLDTYACSNVKLILSLNAGNCIYFDHFAIIASTIVLGTLTVIIQTTIYVHKLGNLYIFVLMLTTTTCDTQKGLGIMEMGANRFWEKKKDYI